ncbi:MAG: sigma-70 family RNA polymerase sigma factor [Saprospiraceae bacterium]|nr:sigma-70 family RNA polymerase sigma factor [Saprospiraceae bacterium]
MLSKVEHQDAALWKRFKAGDKSALKHIYSDHIESLLQYGYRFCQDRSVIEDCIHDLFVYLWSNRETIGETDSIRSYLLVVLRRRIYRSLSNSTETSHESAAEEAPDFELNIEHQIIGKETDTQHKEELEKALTGLSARQREAIYLKFYKNQSYEDICEIMEINYQSARNLVFAGIRALRKTMTSLWWLVVAIVG